MLVFVLFFGSTFALDCTTLAQACYCGSSCSASDIPGLLTIINAVGTGGAGTCGGTNCQATPGSNCCMVQGASGASGASGAQGASGASGAQGASGASGAQGASGASGAQGASGASGAQGASGASGAQGASGASGAQGASGASGASGARGAAASCGGLQTISVVPSLEVVDNVQGGGFDVTVVVSESAALGAPVTVKITTDSVTLPALLAAPLIVTNNAPGFSGVVTCVLFGTHTLVCAVPNGVLSLKFHLDTDAAKQGFAEITAFLSNQALNDCAVDSRTVLIGTSFLNGKCGCQASGTFVLTPTGCTGSCAQLVRRNVENLDKRALVPGVRSSVDVSVTYRRKPKDSSSSSSDSSVSRCGPRVRFLVDRKVIWSNTATVVFGAEGVVSGTVEFLARSGVPVSFDLELTKSKHCDSYDLQVWDPRFDVTPLGAVAGGIDPSSPKEFLHDKK